MNAKSIVRVALFTIVFIVICFITSEILKTGVRKVKTGEAGKVNKIVTHEIDPEIVIFGGSTALSQFDPQIIQALTNFDTYNLGLEGLCYSQYKGLLREFCSYSKNCKYLILVPFPPPEGELHTRNKLFEPYKFYANVNNENIYESLHDIQPELLYKIRNIPFYEMTVFNYDFVSLSYSGWIQYFNNIKDNQDNGYEPREFNWRYPNNINNEKQIEITYEENVITEIQEDIIKFNNKGIRIILVVTPIHKDGMSMILNYNEYKEKLKSLCIVSEMNIFIDYSNTEKLNNTEYFYEYTHLNKKGATEFTNLFCEDLKQIIHYGK